MTKLPLSLALAVLAVGCGGQTFDVAGPDASTDGGSDTAPNTDAPPTDAPVETGPDWTACHDVTECVVVPASCCGMCGVASASDSTAVNKAYESAYRSSVCGPGTGCPDCAGRNDPNLQPTCDDGHCHVLDVATNMISDCTADEQCTLRAWECCEPCGSVAPSDLIALSKTEESLYVNEVCPPTSACPGCSSSYPPAFSAKCDPSTHHCVVFGAK